MEQKQGILVRGIGSFYTAEDENGQEYTLRCKKKFRRQNISPLVGDFVQFTPGSGEEHGWLEEILPRKTCCIRPPVANVTRLVIVLSPVPEPDLVLTDRLISEAVGQEMKVLIAVNKCDLDPTLADRIRHDYAACGFPVFSVSAKTGSGIGELRDALRGEELCCLTGQSGAGKSTLLNSLLDLSLETGDISRKISRGKNTTRHTELLRKEGIRVMDTAGFSLLETEPDLDPCTLRERYPEFRPYEGRCRFRECLHDREPGCAVEEAAGAGEISMNRLERYRVLLAEAREGWKKRYD